MCLLSGADWFLKYNDFLFFFKALKSAINFSLYICIFGSENVEKSLTAWWLLNSRKELCCHLDISNGILQDWKQSTLSLDIHMAARLTNSSGWEIFRYFVDDVSKNSSQKQCFKV